MIMISVKDKRFISKREKGPRKEWKLDSAIHTHTLIHIYHEKTKEKRNRKPKKKMTRESGSQGNDSRMYMTQEFVHDVKRRTKRCITANSHDNQSLENPQKSLTSVVISKMLSNFLAICVSKLQTSDTNYQLQSQSRVTVIILQLYSYE